MCDTSRHQLMSDAHIQYYGSSMLSQAEQKCLTEHHAMKTNRKCTKGGECQNHVPAVLHPREINPGTHCRGVWVGLRASLNAVEKRKSLTARNPTAEKSGFYFWNVPGWAFIEEDTIFGHTTGSCNMTVQRMSCKQRNTVSVLGCFKIRVNFSRFHVKTLQDGLVKSDCLKPIRETGGQLWKDF